MCRSGPGAPPGELVAVVHEVSVGTVGDHQRYRARADQARSAKHAASCTC